MSRAKTTIIKDAATDVITFPILISSFTSSFFITFDATTAKPPITTRARPIHSTVFNAVENAVGFLSHIIPKAIIEAAITAMDVAKSLTVLPIALILTAFPKSLMVLLKPFEKMVKALFNSFPLFIASRSFDTPKRRVPAINVKAIDASIILSVSAKLKRTKAPAKIAIAPAVLINASAFKFF